MHWHNGFFMGGMWLWWVLFIVAIGVIVWFGAGRSRGLGDGGQESAEEVLKRRFARGEIDRETYERMLSDLRR